MVISRCPKLLRCYVSVAVGTRRITLEVDPVNVTCKYNSIKSVILKELIILHRLCM